MKTLTSVAFGAAALATALLGSATPAEARSHVGVYIGAGGYGCGDYWFRRNHPYRCGYGVSYDRYPYYNNYNYNYGYYHHRHRDWDRDRDHRRRHHDRW